MDWHTNYIYNVCHGWGFRRKPRPVNIATKKGFVFFCFSKDMFMQNTLLKYKQIIGSDLNFLKLSRCLSMALPLTIQSIKTTNSTQSNRPIQLTLFTYNPSRGLSLALGFARNIISCSDYDFSNLKVR